MILKPIDLYWVDGVAYTEADNVSVPCMPDLGCESGVLTLVLKHDRDDKVTDPPGGTYNELFVVGAYVVEDGRSIGLSSSLFYQLYEHFYESIMELR